MNARLFLLLLVTAPLPTFAQQTPQQIADAELPSLLTIYKDIHTHPELSTQEQRTSALLEKELKAIGWDVTENVGKYDKPGQKCFGVVGLMKNGDGPVVLVRTDLDALPVQEETGLPYASTVVTKNEKGDEVHVMHACGHDAHVSMIIGVARSLVKLKDQWHGSVVFVGQPAEEVGTGARAMLRDGLYTRWPKPNYALGFHDKADLEIDHIGVTEGYTSANVDSVDVTVHGIGGHGAYVYRTKDPIVLAAEMINQWQTIASRENNPLDPVVVTVGSIHGGTRHNIIPAEVKMQLTVRTTKDEVRARVLEAIQRIAKAACIGARAPEPVFRIDQDNFTPALYNHAELAKKTSNVFRATLGADKVILQEPLMGGEDFSRYGLEGIPSFFFFLGTLPPERIQAMK